MNDGALAGSFFRPLVDLDARPQAEDLVFAFERDRVLVLTHGEGWRLPAAGELPHFLDRGDAGTHFLGHLEGRACYGLDLSSLDPQRPAADPHDAPWRREKLRGLWGKVEDAHFATAGFAFQILHWAATHRFCGRCGTPTEPSPRERARCCPRCELVAYPRVAPVVIAVVLHGDRLLLAKPRNAAYHFYSALAGFVEAGESLEHALRREVREEANIEIGNLRYMGSQPWPFPHSLMVGFLADYQSGDLRLDPDELADGAFYPVDELPALPSPLSIARQLIDRAIPLALAARG